MPVEPIHRMVAPVVGFMQIEAASGFVLLSASVAALVLANSPIAPQYFDFWRTPVDLRVGDFHFHQSLLHLLNDGLMAIFFFVVGLEVKRELVLGELRDFRRAAFPLAAAVGGMIAPAAVFLALQAGQPAERGWGIPMATDIAFVVGCLAVLGKRVPQSLRIMLLSLAIADDIGAILVIALGYASGISLGWLGLCVMMIAVVSLFARLGVRSIAMYWLLGAGVWFTCHESGVHSTIAGVVLGMMTPARSYVSDHVFKQFLERAREVLRTDDEVEMPHRPEEVELLRRVTREAISPLEYLEARLHPWVSFAILPAFALANAGVAIGADQSSASVALAVMLGLVLGKPLGIFALSWVAVKIGLARLPEHTSWGMILGAGCLAGIGFTMSLFIAGIALEGDDLNAAKIGILGGSVSSAVTGMGILWWRTRRGLGNRFADHDPHGVN